MSDEDERSWTLDNTTVASNPGGIKVEPLIWLRNDPFWPSVWFLLLLVSTFISVKYGAGFLLFVGLFVAANIFYWQRIRDHFMHGCANPSVIVGIDPVLVATGTDLSKGDGEYPAIRIVQQDLNFIQGQAPKVGDRLVSVALYNPQSGDNGSSPCWGSFDPIPVDFATSNLQAKRISMSTFGTGDWSELDDWLAEVPKPYQPGLYAIDKYQRD